MDTNKIDLEILQEIYLEEAWKQIECVDDFLEMKKEMSPICIEKSELNRIFRVLHSIKGSASMMGYPSIAETAHHAEELFIYLQDIQEPSQQDLFAILSLVKMVLSYIKSGLRRLESGEEITDFGWTVVKRIKNFLEHVEGSENLENTNDAVLYTRKGRKSIPFTNFRSLLPQMERLISLMSRELSKEVMIEVSGLETEVPRDIYDKTSLVVLQLLKNSMDHGIEDSVTRKEIGKLPIGKICMDIVKTAYKVYVTFRDDGRGLDKHRILEEARERGVLEKEEWQYTDSEIFHFLLRPGFTTKSFATLFSGRGMGLDVVNASVAALGGCIRIESRELIGTAFFIEFPLIE